MQLVRGELRSAVRGGAAACGVGDLARRSAWRGRPTPGSTRPAPSRRTAPAAAPSGPAAAAGRRPAGRRGRPRPRGRHLPRRLVAAVVDRLRRRSRGTRPGRRTLPAPARRSGGPAGPSPTGTPGSGAAVPSVSRSSSSRWTSSAGCGAPRRGGRGSTAAARSPAAPRATAAASTRAGGRGRARTPRRTSGPRTDGSPSEARPRAAWTVTSGSACGSACRSASAASGRDDHASASAAAARSGRGCCPAAADRGQRGGVAEFASPASAASAASQPVRRRAPSPCGSGGGRQVEQRPRAPPGRRAGRAPPRRGRGCRRAGSPAPPSARRGVVVDQRATARAAARRGPGRRAPAPAAPARPSSAS